MVYLPLPEPWTIETLPEYVDQLVEFIKAYGDIPRFNTHEVFTRGLPVDWAPEYPLETWLAIVSGKYADSFSDSFSKFVRLSQELPFSDVRTTRNATKVRKQHKMSPKKSHEVDTMVAFLEEMTKEHVITAKSVLDVGSGLGYLSSELAKSGYNVVGVEGDAGRAKKAAERTCFHSVHRMVVNHTDLDIVKDPCVSLSLRISPCNHADDRRMRRSIFEHDPALLVI
jgi:hypothetical protein